MLSLTVSEIWTRRPPTCSHTCRIFCCLLAYQPAIFCVSYHAVSLGGRVSVRFYWSWLCSSILVLNRFLGHFVIFSVASAHLPPSGNITTGGTFFSFTLHGAVMTSVLATLMSMQWLKPYTWCSIDNVKNDIVPELQKYQLWFFFFFF